MRIRELARLYAAKYFPNSLPQAYVCGFNQSPWDTMTNFSPPSSPKILPSITQVNGNGLSATNERSGASMSLMEWEECVGDVVGQEFDSTDSDGVGGAGEVKSNDGNGVVFHGKKDGNNSQCKREGMYGKTLREQHLALDNKNTSKGTTDKKKKKPVRVVEMEGAKRTLRSRKASVAAANPYDIYYYSGFGPRWGKKRGNDKVDNGCNSNIMTNLETERVSGPSTFINEGIGYIEGDDDDDVKGILGHRKRTRRSVKARSLKSLM